MRTLEILEELFFVQRGYLSGNHFVHRSDEPVLIDTGYVSAFAETESALLDLGMKSEQVRVIINTHTHCDHVGGNRIIQDKSGCEIAMHRVGKHFIDTRDDWATWWRYYGQEGDFFRCHTPLEDGDIIYVGPHEFEVIYTPGHAADGIVLYNRKEKLLISSDTLWENDTAVMTLRVEGTLALFTMLESLTTLSRLDVKIVYPGHGRPFTDFRGAIASARKKLRGFLGSRRRIGSDLIKKIVVYTLLMKGSVEEAAFFDHVMGTHWYRETVDLYFNGNYKGKYYDIMSEFLRRGIIKRARGRIFTTAELTSGGGQNAPGGI